MLCPFCQASTRVLESRIVEQAMRRRRSCLGCDNRFTTYEKVFFRLQVIKKSGTLQPFDVEKVKNSVAKALGKTDLTAVRYIAKNVEQRVLRQKQIQISTRMIGSYVLQELRKQDKLAYVRFASIHKDLNLARLAKEVQTIRGDTHATTSRK